MLQMAQTAVLSAHRMALVRSYLTHIAAHAGLKGALLRTIRKADPHFQRWICPSFWAAPTDGQRLQVWKRAKAVRLYHHQVSAHGIARLILADQRW